MEEAKKIEDPAPKEPENSKDDKAKDLPPVTAVETSSVDSQSSQPKKSKWGKVGGVLKMAGVKKMQRSPEKPI